MFGRLVNFRFFRFEQVLMNNLWVHPEFKATKVGFNRSCYSRRMHSAFLAQKRESYFQRNIVPLFLSLCLILVPFSLGLIFLKSSAASTVVLDLMDYNIPLFRSALTRVSKADFLASLNAAQRDDLALKIYYISEIIKEARTSAAADELATAIVSESLDAGYDPLFVTAVIMAESRFNKHARSHKGALGLMQLLPPTAKFISNVGDVEWRGYWNLVNDPSYNIRLGISYLKYLEEEFDLNREKMLMAYNWGPGNVQKYLKREKSVPSVTKGYAKKILALHRDWSADYEQRKPAFKYMNANFAENTPVIPLSKES